MKSAAESRLIILLCVIAVCQGCKNCNWGIFSKPHHHQALESPCDELGNKYVVTGYQLNLVHYLTLLIPFASSGRYKLMSALNLLCNATNPATSQTNIVRRDGCYGCFFRAVNYGRPRQVLIELNNCSRQYLNGSGTPPGTNFQTCSNQLNAYVSQLVVQLDPTQGPQSCLQSQVILCEFVNCVREQNANALLEQCYQEVGFTQMDVAGRRNYYTNMTRCVLGRIRCSRYNPISGELQTAVQSRHALYSLQVTSTGLIRVFKIPVSLLNTSPQGQFCQQSYILDDDLQAPYPIADSICDTF